MAILRIKDENGNIQEILAIKGRDGKDGKDGDDYILTEADKQEIANLIPGGGGGGTLDLSGVLEFKKATDADVNDFSNPDKLAKSVLMWTPETYDDIGDSGAFVFSYGDSSFGMYSQIAVGTEGNVYIRSANDNFAEWHCVNDEKYCIKTDFETFVADVNDIFDSHSETLNDHTEALGNRVEKIDFPSGVDGSIKGLVYVVGTDNVQTSRQLKVNLSPDSIPYRDNSGNFYVNTPKGDKYCANKQYVDEAIATLRAELINGDEESY